MLSVRSDTHTADHGRRLCRPFPRQQISQVAGVAQVAIFGDQKPSIRIQVDPAKLARQRLTLEDIRSTLVPPPPMPPRARSTPTRPASRSRPTIRSLEAEPFNDVMLAYRNGAPIRVRDVGQAVAGRSTATSRPIRTTRTASSWPCSSSPAPTSSRRSTRSRRSCRS